VTRPLHLLADVSARQGAGFRTAALVIIGPDSGPEVIDFVPAGQSPTGSDLVVVANEITGTVSIYAAVVP